MLRKGLMPCFMKTAQLTTCNFCGIKKTKLLVSRNKKKKRLFYPTHGTSTGTILVRCLVFPLAAGLIATCMRDSLLTPVLQSSVTGFFNNGNEEPSHPHLSWHAARRPIAQPIPIELTILLAI